MSALLNTYIDMVGPEACCSKQGCLALVDAQTGLGKTYQATALQLEHLKSNSKKTLFYATNLRINVKEAYESLLARIDEDHSLSPESKDKFKRNVILIPAQATCIGDLSDSDWEILLGVLEHNARREIKKLLDKANMIEEAKAVKCSSILDEDLQVLYGSIFSLLRSFFRQQGQQEKSIEDVLNRVFPAGLIDAESTQVIFMTTAKLLYPWHGIQRTHRISDFLENALLILDEFDRQQSEFLAHLISTVSDYDIIALTRKLYSSFESFSIQGSQEFSGVNKCFDKFRETLGNHQKKWRADLRPYITEKTILQGRENQNRIFTMLSDRMSIHAINFKHEDLRSNIDNRNGSHEIGSQGDLSAIKFVNSGAQLVRSFCNAMLSAVLKLKTNIEKSDDTRPYTTENLVEKILNNLGLPELTKSIMSLISARLSFKLQSEYRAYSFHDSGYEISNISKYSETDNTAIASTFDLALTSSGLLAHWVLSGAKILGISATASSETAIHNFDLQYLREVLGKQLLQPNSEQKLAIQNEYCDKRRYEEQGVEISVTSISQRVTWGGVKHLYQEFKGACYHPSFLDTELMQMLGVTNAASLGFSLGRVDKLIESIKHFSEHHHNRYHFCMLNNSYRTTEFYEFMNFVGEKFGVIIFENINAASFRSDQFQQVLDILQTTLQKVVVITNYQATGAGLSPSYQIRHDQELVYVGAEGSEPFQFKTDIDSMYIEQPKSLIGSHIQDHVSEREKAAAIKKNVHDALMLHEKGIVIASEVKGKLKSFISSNVTNRSVGSLISTYKDSEDYRYAVYRFIEQALGRMCRTEWKQAQISIMYDAEEDFVKALAMESRNLDYLSYEYRALIREVKKHYKVVVEAKQRVAYHPKASRNFAHIQRLITSVYEHQNKDSIGQYDRLRKSMLERPTLNHPPSGEDIRYYIALASEASQYEYQKEFSEGKGITEIFINPTDASSLRLVSESSARLSLLMKNTTVAAHFEDEGFAQSFGDTCYVLAPAMFDIYMGALGEEAVKALLLQRGYQLESMPEGCVEWFDGCIQFNNRVLLVDVKHWDLSNGCLEHDNTLHKCQTKLLKIRENMSDSFKGKAIQALYVNTVYEGQGGIVTRKFSHSDKSFLEHANVFEADIIEVPGVIDSVSGSSNVPTMAHLLDILNELAEQKS